MGIGLGVQLRGGVCPESGTEEREGNKLYESEKSSESEIAYRKSLEGEPALSEGTYNWGTFV